MNRLCGVAAANATTSRTSSSDTFHINGVWQSLRLQTLICTELWVDSLQRRICPDSLYVCVCLQSSWPELSVSHFNASLPLNLPVYQPQRLKALNLHCSSSVLIAVLGDWPRSQILRCRFYQRTCPDLQIKRCWCQAFDPQLLRQRLLAE